jgi:hypothetical protein
MAMTDSIFDPTGPQTEHSGTRNLGPDAANLSHLPPDLADGKVAPDPNQPDEDPETEQIARAEGEVDSDRKPPEKTRPE